MNPDYSVDMSPEEFRKKLFEDLDKNDSQYLGEIAMPGIKIPVDTSEL